jgi:hypothetical protein
MRQVLAIPLEEVQRHFEVNERQNLKVVAPSRLGAEMMARLRAKAEVALDGGRWRHSPADEPNLVCESAEFAKSEGDGFTISFGNERALRRRISTAGMPKSIFPSMPWRRSIGQRATGKR